ARGPRRGLARCRRGRRRAGQPRPRRPAVAARGLPARGAKHPAPGGRPAGPHLQPRPRRAPVHAGRAREGARGDGPRALLAVSPTFGRTSASAIDSVLLIAFGGPTAPAEIRPFLANVGRGRNIPRERLEEVARHYEAMPGGRSPLNALTEAQAAGLRAALVRGGRPLPVYVGMRNWHPSLPGAPAAMAAAGRRRAVGLILSAFRSEASWGRYAADVAAARARVAGAPEVVYAPPWFEHEHFIAAAADRAAAALGEIPPQARERTPLVFTAHSIPRAMAATSPHVADFGAAAAAVARRLRHARWLLAYQSRSGGPRDPWLEPDVGEAIRDLAKAGERRVVLAPIGFVVDLDVRVVEARRRLGGTIVTERADGFLVEAGPDSFLSEKPWALALCRRLGVEDRLVRTDDRFRRVFVWFRGLLHPLPDGFQLLAPTRLAPFATSSLFSWRGKARMALDLVLPRGGGALGGGDDESLGAFVRRRLGAEALERVAQPLVAGIYTADPEELSVA